MTRPLRFALSVLAVLSFTSVAAQDCDTGRASFRTTLTRTGPAPQAFENVAPPKGVERISYPSGSWQLAGWLARPAKGRPPYPAIIYLHGGFSFGIEDYESARPFLDAGYAVMYPFLRGENGNPGNFELFYGEVSDALAAVRWLAKHQDVDSQRIAVFGHSVGGGVADLTSLCNGYPIRMSGSAGALYPPQIFQAWKSIAPFDVNNPQEVALRNLPQQLASVRRPHHAYVGSEEPGAKQAPLFQRAAAEKQVPLTVTVVPGDHFGALAPAMQDFLKKLAASTN